MADRKATNKYYPPDWDPSKGSINTYVGQHPLRDRARKLDQGILIVRFEMPYSIWCGGCEKHIGMGVRYNAEKKKVGMYYSTPIWSFRMKCHLCNHWIEIHTDPKNAQYTIISGARRREEHYDPADIGLPVLQDDEQKEKLSTDAFYKLEHDTTNTLRAADTVPHMTQLMRYSDKTSKDPYTLSQTLRRHFRNDKKEREAEQRQGAAIADKHSLLLDILPASADDDISAKSIEWRPAPQTVDEKKNRVHASSIFQAARPSKRTRLNTRSTSTSLKSKSSPCHVSSSSSSSSSSTLISTLAAKVRPKADPFAVPTTSSERTISTSIHSHVNNNSSRRWASSTNHAMASLVRKRTADDSLPPSVAATTGAPVMAAATIALACGDYGNSDEDNDNDHDHR